MMKTTKIKLNTLDIVRVLVDDHTGEAVGKVAVVTNVNSHNEAHLTFLKDKGYKVAWYKVTDLEILGNVKDNLPASALL